MIDRARFSAPDIRDTAAKRASCIDLSSQDFYSQQVKFLFFLPALSRRINRHISNRDKVGYDSGRNTLQNSESILTVRADCTHIREVGLDQYRER
jgi:hypothetical protein